MSGTSKPQEQPTPDWAWEDDDAIDEDDEELEAEMNCGQFPGSGGCSMAGTEYCDWSCPFNRPTRRKSK